MTKMKFSKLVEEKLEYYVYRLIDPRNGSTFYVGKGKGNRVFAHANGEKLIETDSMPDRLSIVSEIRRLGLEVGHVIHRHGLDEKTAFEVEGALMDAFPGLTNIAGGHGNSDRGAMHAKEIIDKIEAEEAVFEHSGVIVIVNHTSDERSVYNAARYAWKLTLNKLEAMDYVFAVRHGIIVGVFIAEEWLPSESQEFADYETLEGRVGFKGRSAPNNILMRYLRKRIPGRIAYTTKYVYPSKG